MKSAGCAELEGGNEPGFCIPYSLFICATARATGAGKEQHQRPLKLECRAEERLFAQPLVSKYVRTYMYEHRARKGGGFPVSRRARRINAARFSRVRVCVRVRNVDVGIRGQVDFAGWCKKSRL